MMYRLCITTLLFVHCSLAVAQGNSRDPLCAQFSPGVPAQSSPYTEMFGDARLNDVCFVNPQSGWAVGDHGVIWTTHDGGANWQLQATPIDCTLRSVQFLDESFGIAVGNYWFSQNGQGRGVILTTHDGGTTWKLQHSPDLPPLHRVKMFDTTNILIAGATSERCPSGLLISRDAGQTWRSLASQLSDGFAAADFYEPRLGIGIGFHGIMQQFQNNIAASQTVDFGHRKIADVKVNQANSEFDITGWAVGDRGLILSSVDQGYRWGIVPGSLPGSAAEVVDLKTIESHGKNLWVAGNPGSVIYMSNDAGKTWKSTLTGISATIRKIVFVNANIGWAVGDLGTILTTQNGGQTWNVQRTGSTKLSVLGLFGDSESIPFEAFASLSANQGFLSGSAMLFRNERNSSEQENLLHESMVRIGGSIGAELSALPILPKELWTTSENLVEQIQKATDGKGMEQLRERLIIAIRQWKPEVLLTSNYTNQYTDSAVEELALREVMEAVKLAADPTKYPHHLTELGLAAWNVKKVYLTMKTGTLGDVHLTPSEPTVRLGIPLEELTYISRSLMEAKKCPAILGFLHVDPNTSETSAALPGKDFFAGLQVVHGEDGRRALSGIYVEFQNEHRRRALQRRNVLGILQSTAKTTQGAGQLVNQANIAAHAGDLTRKLDPDSAVQVLLDMAEQLHQTGDWHAAADIYLILTRNYAPHPLVRQAFLRLMYYSASGETISGEVQNDGMFEEKNEWVDDPRRPGYRIQKTSMVKVQTVQGSLLTDQQNERALLLGQFLDQNIPDLADEISMRFAVASVLRKSGWEQDAARFYRARANLRFDDVWGTRARTEYWLTVPNKLELPMEQQELPMPAMVCAYTRVKPFLDGKFDEEKDKNVWRQSQLYTFTPAAPRKRLSELLQENAVRRVGAIREERLRSMSQNFGTQAMFLHDAEYWYIGLRCPKVPEFVYPPVVSRQRLRDAAAMDQDRIEILIDMDRDYKTCYSLTIDSRGWVTDACLGDKSWNPQWHVARHEDEEAWYIEAAIPFSALSDRPFMPDTVWSVAIRRLVPGIGIECWNAENSFDLNEGFGLLVFP